MNIGQVYNVKFENFLNASSPPVKLEKKAKLIFESDYFYTFEYKSGSGALLRTTIDKRKYKGNNSIIEVINDK